MKSANYCEECKIFMWGPGSCFECQKAPSISTDSDPETRMKETSVPSPKAAKDLSKSNVTAKTMDSPMKAEETPEKTIVSAKAKETAPESIVCPVCTYMNDPTKTKCDMCETPLKASTEAPAESPAVLICPACTYHNDISKAKCELCETPLGFSGAVDPMDGIFCIKCSKVNALSATACAFCGVSIYDEPVPVSAPVSAPVPPPAPVRAPAPAPVPMRECPVCKARVRDDEESFDEHAIACLFAEPMPEGYKACRFCAFEMPIKSIRMHMLICEKKPKGRGKDRAAEPKKAPGPGPLKPAAKAAPPASKVDQAWLDKVAEIMRPSTEDREREFAQIEAILSDPAARMTKVQVESMMYMHRKSALQHDASTKEMLEKVAKLGYGEREVEALRTYLEHQVPLIIHVHVLKHMEFFVKDTNYRSQFETNKSSGTLSRPTRIGWETRMFDKHYDAATDFERVKYGTINYTADPTGVNACRAYGPSYFHLKDDLRYRVTLADRDSSNANTVISTLKYPFATLAKLNDNELRATVEAALGKPSCSKVVSVYKEIQIHGPIEFNRDIQKFYVNDKEYLKEEKYTNMVHEFIEKTGLPHEIFTST